MMKKIAFVFLFCIFGLATAGYSQAKDTLVENGCKYVMHEVQKGQTLYGLAKQYRLTVERLVEDNPGTENGIQIGQQLKIYAGQADLKHVVSKGESLYKISKMYGVTVAQLAAWNPGLTERLDIGQEIIVRKATVTVAPKAQQPVVRREPVTAHPAEPERIPQAETVKERVDIPVVETRQTVSVAERKQVYNVYLLLPLYTQEGVQEDDGQKVETLEAYERIKSFDFIQFYEAAMLAVEDIAAQDVKVNFYVKDVNERNNAELGRWIAEGVFADADMIIGPFFRENFRTLLSYAQNHRIMVVNPFTVNPVETSARLFRTMATFGHQAVNLADYIRQHYSKAQVLLLNNGGSDSRRISVYHSSMMKALQDNPGISVKEVNYKSGGVAALQASLNPTCENFVVAFFDGEITVTHFIQSMNRKELENVTLVTSSDWRKYDKIETEYYSRLKTHYIDQFFVDYSRPEVVRFIDRFRERYNLEPTLDHFAFQGYDITRFFLTALIQYGNGFGLEVNELKLPLLCTQFHYVRGASETFENTYCSIYKLKDYRYTDAWLEDEEETTQTISPAKNKKRR
ncbi:MAG: LysM peptidoglycan-binding domain-containing protein [Bacteroidales bacterium]|nr:LysM peptidoglycan-binding domain-containing protein [Bacteroidales bacterium]MBP5613693.1 LysM peptidoglycan-binding domain-containing protein [Bacteroidales bacterium]